MFRCWLFKIFISIVLFNFQNVSECVINSDVLMAHELQYLSELPLDKLLKVKKSLQEISCVVDDSHKRQKLYIDHNWNNSNHVTEIPSERSLNINLWNNNNQSVLASALQNEYEYHQPQESAKSLQEDQKPSKIQSFFQLSITALAFFAFGGYLLCMIVQAIKSKGTTYYHPSAFPMTNAQSPGIQLKKRRPSFGRRKRNVNGTDTSEVVAAPTPQAMYRALVFIAENYVQIQRVL